MTREETISILSIIKTAYPKFYVNLQRQDLLNTISLWNEMFANDDVKIVAIAVKELINSFQFPPTIADVKEKMRKLTINENKCPNDYWNELVNIVRDGTYHSVEGFENASEPVKRFLHSPAQVKELSMLDETTFMSVTKGQFDRAIKTILDEKKELNAMLPETKALIQKIANNLSIDNKERTLLN